MLREKAGPDHDFEFTASSGWCRFKNHCSLYNVEGSGESVHADVKAAEEFLGTFKYADCGGKLFARENVQYG